MNFMLRSLLLLVLVMMSSIAFAQKKSKATLKRTDSLPKMDTAATFAYQKIWIDSAAPAQKIGVEIKKDKMPIGFVLATVLLFIFGILNLIFNKYISELFILSFRSTFRSASLKSQLSSNKAASLLLNIFFFISSGVFLYLVLKWQQIQLVDNQWLQLFVCIGIVAVIYAVKYIVLIFLGQIFQQQKALDDYVFIVFLANKLIGVALLPIVCILLMTVKWHQPIIVCACFFIGVFILYRYLISYVSVAQRMQMQKLHFFMYLCGIELLPLLIVYKATLGR